MFLLLKKKEEEKKILFWSKIREKKIGHVFLGAFTWNHPVVTVVSDCLLGPPQLNILDYSRKVRILQCQTSQR